jgi:hypothetical protein
MIILFSNVSSVASVVMRHTYAKHVQTTYKTWCTMAFVLTHEFQDTKEFNDTEVLLLRLMNSSLSYSLEFNEAEAFDPYTSQHRLLTVQDRVADAIARANTMHKNFIQEASVYLSFTFETSGQQSEWMNT